MIAHLLLATGLAAQDSTRLTLAEVMARALEQHPSIAVAGAARDRATAELGEARSSWLPRLSLEAALTRFEQPMVVQPLHGFDPSNPPLFDRALFQSGLNLSYTLLDFGQRGARVRAARALAGAADQAVTAAGQQLLGQAAGAYLGVVSARDLLAAEDLRLGALAAEADRTRRLQAEGRAARVEILRVDAELARARADRIAAAARLDVAEHELAQYAGLPHAAVSGVGLERLALRDTAPPAPDRESLVRRARAASPELGEMDRRTQAAQAGLAAARATWLPELRVAGGYVDRGRVWGDFAAEWQAGVVVSYPLFTGGARESAIRRARAEARAADEQRRLAGLNLDRGIDRVLAALSEARARVTALERATEQTEEVARIERLALDVGSRTQVDYLDAEANLLRARAGLIEARHGEIRARIELARILGELSTEWLTRTLESVP